MVWSRERIESINAFIRFDNIWKSILWTSYGDVWECPISVYDINLYNNTIIERVSFFSA